MAWSLVDSVKQSGSPANLYGAILIAGQDGALEGIRPIDSTLTVATPAVSQACCGGHRS